MKFNIKRIGLTVLGQSIDCWISSAQVSTPKVLIVSGVHGDESEGIDIANGLIELFLTAKFSMQNVAVIPCLNRDGETLGLRSNYNDVDLNRNIPTRNWVSSFTNPRYKPGTSAGSEPETKAFMDVFYDFKPDLIISLHSFSESLILYGNPSERFNTKVASLAEKLDLKIVEKMSYEVTGSLNTFSNEEKIPTITIEAPRDESWEAKRENFILAIGQFIMELK
jgi:protein MpaA